MPLFRNILFCLFFLFLFCYSSLAQTTHQVTGKVVEEGSGETVPFAQIALYKTGSETPERGTVTEDDGIFVLQAEKGKYDLEITFVGYENKRIENVRVRNKDKDLGTIRLASEAQRLKEVVVESEVIEEEPHRPFTTNMEGMQINPEETIANTGGTLLDVLRNTPSITVSEDGSISLRGSGGTNILIDGRNSALASDPEQIPASAIESIQVINNPNSKYDAQSAGGIINIKLKQGEDMGTNGGAELTLGNRWRMNHSLRGNHRTTRYNVYGGYSFRHWPRVGTRTTTRETFENNELLEQSQNSDNRDTEHTFNYGGDYYFGKNIISYEGSLNTEKETDVDNSRAQVTNTRTNERLLQYFRRNNETEENLTLDNALIYERTFDNPDREFRAIVSHSFRDQLENQEIDVYNNQISPAGEQPDRRERSVTEELRQTAILQADYVHPLNNGQLEAGYKTILRSFDNVFVYEILDEADQNWIDQQDISNRFLYEDQVYATYLIYSNNFNKFDLSVGTRLEQTFVQSRLYNTNEENKQQYLNLFPSVQAMYNLSDENAFKITYSRRIDRPNAWRLNPFPDVTDSLNIRQGNPNLQPEYIHSLEAGHMLLLKNFDLTTNLFYRHVDGQLDFIVRVEDGISYFRPENLNTAVTYGFELINSTQIFPWWSFNASYSLFRSEVDGTNLGAGFENEGISW